MSGALQAIVFDFDGVIADSEPLHLRAFQHTLADIGVTLSAEDYYGRYLGYDDVGVFVALARDRGVGLTDQQAFRSAPHGLTGVKPYENAMGLRETLWPEFPKNSGITL